MLLDYKTQVAQEVLLNPSMYQKVKTFFSGGDYVYLLTSYTSSLKTDTTIFQQDYVGPLVIKTVLYFTHYILKMLTIVCY